MEQKLIYQVIMWHSFADDLGNIVWEDEVDSYWESIEDAYKQALKLQKEYTYQETLDTIDEEEQTYFAVNKITINPFKVK